MKDLVSTSDDRSTTKDAQRAEMLLRLDQELAEIARVIDAQRATASSGDPHLEALERKSAQLQGLREEVQSAVSLVALAQLRTQVIESLRSASDAVQSASRGPAGGGGGSANRMAAEATYQARMSAVERSMTEITREDRKLFDSADALADRYGIDISGFKGTRDALADVAEDARKQGDRTTAVLADALSARNTAVALQTVADGITDPAAKADAQKQADQARTNADKAEQQARQAAAAQAARETSAAEARGELHFDSAADRQAFIDQQTALRMNGFDQAKRIIAQGDELPKDTAQELLARRARDRREENTAQRDEKRVGTPDQPAPDRAIPDADEKLSKTLEEHRTGSRDAILQGFIEPASPAGAPQLAALDSAIQEQAKQAATPVVIAGASRSGEGEQPGEDKAPIATPPVETGAKASANVLI